MAECVGSDWLINEGRGKTFYVGSRKNSSRFARIYEKGKQLGDKVSTHSRPKAAGDKESSWVRVELVSTHSRPKAAGRVMRAKGA